MPAGVLGTDLVLWELGLLPSSDQGDVARGAEHFCAADAAADLCVELDAGRRKLPRQYIPLATFWSPDLDEYTVRVSSFRVDAGESAYRGTLTPVLPRSMSYLR